MYRVRATLTLSSKHGLNERTQQNVKVVQANNEQEAKERYQIEVIDSDNPPLNRGNVTRWTLEFVEVVEL